MLQLALWAVFLVAVMFFGVVFPIRMQQLDASGKIKYIHITMVLLGLILPCVPVAVTFGTGGFALRDTVFPPIICLGVDRGATVYSLSIVESILIATGISLLILVFHKFIKVKCSILEGINITLTEQLLFMLQKSDLMHYSESYIIYCIATIHT